MVAPGDQGCDDEAANAAGARERLVTYGRGAVQTSRSIC